MNARPVLFLVVSFLNLFSLNVADIIVGRRFERSYENSSLIVKVPVGKTCSFVDCGSLCDMASACQAFCYSQFTALCYLSQPNVSSGQSYDGLDSQCYDATGCPMTKGYAWYGARCIKGYGNTMNYTDARAICTQNGAHLYHFKTLEWDQQPIEDLRTAVGNLAGDSLWVGADDLEVQGQYQWSDSSLLAGDSPLWGPGEPSYPAECCATLRFYDLKLNDVMCSSTYQFVCQIDA